MLLLVNLMIIGLASCGDDDKSTTIAYYLNVEEEFLVNGSDRQINYPNPNTLMMEAIRNVYPTPNEQGNDEAVIAACDEAYREYVETYTGYHDHITCMAHLVRGTQVGGIIRQNQRLKTYKYDINPTDSE